MSGFSDAQLEQLKDLFSKQNTETAATIKAASEQATKDIMSKVTTLVEERVASSEAKLMAAIEKLATRTQTLEDTLNPATVATFGMLC